MKFKKLLSIILTSAMIPWSAAYAETDIVSMIADSGSGAEIANILDSLTAEQESELGIDLSAYHNLKYRKYIGDAIYNTAHSDADSISDAFEDIMEQAVYTEVINTFSLGVSYNDKGKDLNGTSIPSGLHFRSANLPNGHFGSASFMMYELNNPWLISGITADVTGGNVGSVGGAGRRTGYFTGFSVTEPPILGEVNKKYAPDTTEFSLWQPYVENDFINLESPVKYDFDVDSKQCNGVVLDEAVQTLSALETDSTPFVLKTSKPEGKTTQNQSVDVLKLTITYDLTILWESQYSTYPADGDTEVSGIDKIEFSWREPIDLSTWAEADITVEANGVPQDFTTYEDSDIATGILLSELKYNSDYVITVNNIKSAEIAGVQNDIQSRTISFSTARSYSELYFEEETVQSIGENEISVSGRTDNGITGEPEVVITSAKGNAVSGKSVTFENYGTDIITAEHSSVSGETLTASFYAVVPVKTTEYTEEITGVNENIITSEYENYVAEIIFEDDSEKEFSVKFTDGEEIIISADEDKYIINEEETGVERKDGKHVLILESGDSVVNVYIDGILAGSVENESAGAQSISTTGDVTFSRLALYRVTDEKPAVEGFEIIGSADVEIETGTELTAKFEYADADGDVNNGTESGWYIADSQDGEYTKLTGENTITAGNSHIGKYLRFEVTPKNDYATGDKVVSDSYKVVLSQNAQAVLNKINAADVYELENIIVNNAELLGVEIPAAVNPKYIYAGIIGNNFTTIEEFTTVFNNAKDEYYYTTEIPHSFIASFNDTGSTLNGQSIYNGLIFSTSASNGRFKSSSYLGFDVPDVRSILGGSIEITGALTNGSRKSAISGYSTVAPPYVGTLYEKIPPEDERFISWAQYTGQSFNTLSTVMMFDHSNGKKTATVTLPADLISDLNNNPVASNSFVARFSYPTNADITNQDIAGGVLKLNIDKTRLYDAVCTTVPANFAKGVNPLDFEYKLVFDKDVEVEDADAVITDVKTGSTITASLSATGSSVMIDITENLIPNTLYNISINGLKYGDEGDIPQVSYYFTTDSIVKDVEICGDLSINVDETSELSFSGYTQDGTRVAIGTPELSVDNDIAEITGNVITAKKRGTAVITAVYNNYDGTETVKKAYITVGGQLQNEDFEAYAGATSELAYLGSKSFMPSAKTQLFSGLGGNLVIWFYDDLTSEGGVYFGDTFVGVKDSYSYTGGSLRSKGWHQIYSDSESKNIYIDGKNAGSYTNGVISIAGLYFDEASVTDTLGTVCTVSNVSIRGANADVSNVYAGATLTGTYSYKDVDNDAENGTVCAWYVGSSQSGEYTVISGANGKEFNTSGYAGKFIKFAVTPKNIYDTGVTVYSTPVKVVTKSTQGGGSSTGGGGGGGGVSISSKAEQPDLNRVYNNDTASTGNEPQAEPAGIFADMATSHWAYKSVEVLKAKGIVNGRDDNNFCPDDTVTRAEFIKMLVLAAGKTAETYNNEFSDVSADAWYAGYVKAAHSLGLASGYEGMFSPETEITREEMTKFVISAINKEIDYSDISAFGDDNDISDWAKPYVYKAVKQGIVSGMGNNIFAAKEKTTRAQAAVIIERLIQAIGG